MTHTQNASDAQCSSQKTQTIGEGKNAAENDVQSCSQLKRGSEPAFPGMDYVSQYGKKNPEGISIRDYFAAAALQGIILDSSVLASLKKDGELVSRSAYEYADAMLKAREGK
jgi:hypothetical protein